MAVRFSWYATDKGRRVDGGTLPPRTPVYVQSMHHRVRPDGYRVLRVVPKHLWKLRRDERFEEVTWLRAINLYEDWPSESGPYRSEDDWELPADPAGAARFRASSPPEEGLSPEIRSSILWIDEAERKRGRQVDLAAASAGDSITIGPKASVDRGYAAKYRARIAEDPRVAVSVIQGAELLELLQVQSRDFLAAGDSFADMIEKDLPYFVERPFGDAEVATLLRADMPLDINIELGRTEGLRSAYALRIDVLDGDDISVVTPPVFLTDVRDRLIASDLTANMLSDDAYQLLELFEEQRGDIAAVARDLGVPPAAAWQGLVTGADELGVESVEVAAYLVRFGQPQRQLVGV